jgi:hypothetical protein
MLVVVYLVNLPHVTSQKNESLMQNGSDHGTWLCTTVPLSSSSWSHFVDSRINRSNGTNLIHFHFHNHFIVYWFSTCFGRQASIFRRHYTPKTASVVPPEDRRPQHEEDQDTIKWLWKWKCIKLVTLLWYIMIHCQQNVKVVLIFVGFNPPGKQSAPFRCLVLMVFIHGLSIFNILFWNSSHLCCSLTTDMVVYYPPHLRYLVYFHLFTFRWTT